MTTTHEMDAYLGDFRDELLAKRGQDGYDALLRVATRISARYPSDDHTDTREAAMSAAAQVAYGDAYLSGVADAWLEARAGERTAMAALTGAMLWAHEIGTSKSEISRAAQVTRVTVDRAVRT